MLYSLLVGRFQPFHDGHKALIQTLLDQEKDVCVAVMDTEMSKRNPYSYEHRHAMIKEAFPSSRVMVISIPHINEAVYGRDVGYNIRHIKIDPELEKISATKIRKKLFKG